jgi:hypothetical protein
MSRIDIDVIGMAVVFVDAGLPADDAIAFRIDGGEWNLDRRPLKCLEPSL